MIIISRTEMLNAADRCDNPDQADVWRRLAHECSAGPALADRIIGRLSAAVIALTVIYALLDPAEALLVAFGDAAARWLL